MEVYEKTKNCLGHCPECDSENLNYGVNIIDGDSLIYPFVCEDCSCEGREAYNIQYSETWFNN